MAHLAFVFCCVIWGSTFILLERVTHVFGPVEIGVWRMASGAAATGLVWWLSERKFRLARRDLGHLLVVAVIFTAPAQVIQSYVLTQHFGHSFFGTMVAAIPLMTIAVSVPMLGILPTARELVGVLGGLACMWLLVEDGVNRGMTAGLLVLTVLIPLSSTLSNTYIKWKLSHIPAAPLTATLLLMSALVLMPLAWSEPALAALHVAGPPSVTVTTTSVFYLLLLGVVGSGFSTMVFIWMILKKGPLFAGMTTYIVPVLSLLWGQLDQETISTRQLVAIAAILVMVAVVQSGSRRKGTGDALEFAEPAIAETRLAPAVVPMKPEIIVPETLAS